MSLLLVAIVHPQDADRVIEVLNEQGHRVTRLASSGGFLGHENATLLLGIDESAQAAVLRIFEDTCSSREIDVPLVLLGRLRDHFPPSVRYGGATIFVVELRDILRLPGDAGAQGTDAPHTG
jgi:uncharacterized protein YaaQ